jgi:hypothetical protein
MRALLLVVLVGMTTTALASVITGSGAGGGGGESGCGVDTSCEAPTFAATTTDGVGYACNSTLATCLDVGPGVCNQIGTNTANDGEIILGMAGNAACVTRVGQLLGASQVQVVNGPFTCSGACYLQDDNGPVVITDSDGLLLNGGVALKSILSTTATLDFPSIPNDSTATLTTTVAGAVANSPVIVIANCALEENINVDQRRVSAANTVSIRLRNHDQTNPIDPASCSYSILVFSL